MTDEPTDGALDVWLVDPISYSGLRYYDLALTRALCKRGLRVTMVGSDSSLMGDDHRDNAPPMMPIYRGTSGSAPKLARGIRYLGASVRFIAAVLRHRPKVIHWQYIEVALIDVIVMSLARRIGAVVVYTAHETLPWDSRPHHRILLGWLYRHVDAVIVHQDDQALQITRRYPSRSRPVQVIRHGNFDDFATLELPQAAARAALGIDPTKPVALFFGTLRESKGFDDLLAAWPDVHARLDEARLVIAGRSMDKQTGERVAAVVAASLASSVTLRIDRIDADAANQYYRAADVIVLPYREVSTSGVLRYAYSSGRAVIATSIGEHPTLVRTGVTGVLVRPGDVAALSDALCALLGRRAAVERMGRWARTFSERELSWDRPAEQTASLYEDLVSLKGVR